VSLSKHQNLSLKTTSLISKQHHQRAKKNAQKFLHYTSKNYILDPFSLLFFQLLAFFRHYSPSISLVFRRCKNEYSLQIFLERLNFMSLFKKTNSSLLIYSILSLVSDISHFFLSIK